MLLYGLDVAPPKKGLRNDPSPIWLKLLEMIASFTIRTMVKTTPETCIACGRYQFLKFYVK
jgi:hypothetical protein